MKIDPSKATTASTRAFPIPDGLARVVWSPFIEILRAQLHRRGRTDRYGVLNFAFVGQFKVRFSQYKWKRDARNPPTLTYGAIQLLPVANSLFSRGDARMLCFSVGAGICGTMGRAFVRRLFVNPNCFR
jgi:hypothetical protein